jgi:hypothetical protein
MNVVWPEDFEGIQQENDFEGVLAAIDIVPEEQIRGVPRI